MVVDGRCEALLQLASSAPDAFTADDEALMVTVAEQVAAALRGARLRSESEQRARRLALASDIARRIAAAESADDVVRTAVRLVHESTGCTSVAGIRLSSDRSEQIFTAVIDGRGDTRLEGRRRPAGEGLVGVALSTARQVSVGRSSLSDVYAWPGEPRLESLIVTPVLVDGVCVAALHVADVEPDRFDETEASLLRAVAEQVAAALRGARLRAESEQRAGRLAVTLQVATAVAGERTVDSTLRAAVRAIAASIEAHAFSAFVPLPETGEQECVIDVDPTGGVEAERRPLEGITTGAVLTGAGQVNIGDARTARRVPAVARGLGIPVGAADAGRGRRPCGGGDRALQPRAASLQRRRRRADADAGRAGRRRAARRAAARRVGAAGAAARRHPGRRPGGGRRAGDRGRPALGGRDGGRRHPLRVGGRLHGAARDRSSSCA